MTSAERPMRMRAWRKYRTKTEPVYEEINVPSTLSQGYLIRILAAGDYTLVNTTQQPSSFNDVYTLGHEGCGVIAEIGNEVKDRHLSVGDKVVILAVPGCGKDECPECARGLPQLCVKGQHHGLGQDGFFTEYVAAHARAVVPLPKGVSPAVGAVATDAVLTAYHAVFRRGEIKKGDVVFQFGLGGLGYNAVQMMLAFGVRVIVSDVKPEVLKAAAAMGVPTRDIVPSGEKARDFAKKNGVFGKVDVVLDFVGVQQTIADAQAIVRMGGRIVCIGTISHETQMDMHLCVRKRVSFLFSYGGVREDLVDVLQMIQRKVIHPQVQMGKMEDFPRVIAKLHAGEIDGRIALTPEGTDVGDDLPLFKL